MRIDPGLTEPTLWLNLTISIQRTSLKYWIKLQEDDSSEPFEIVDYRYIPIGSLEGVISFHYDADFFEQREDRESYHFMIFAEPGDEENGSFDIEINYELRY